MAFQSNQIDIELEYNLNNTPANFSLIDNTDYSAETYSNILGLLRAVGPSGSQFYNNTNYASPDIDIDNSTSSADLGSLPQVGGKVTNGLYNFTYTIKIEDMLQSHTVVSNNIVAKTFTVVGNIASLILDATAAGWEIIDNTTESLTIVSATYSAATGLTTVTIDETLPPLTSLAQFQFTVDRIFSKQFQQDYSYVSPSVCIDVDIDDCCSSVTVTDNTAYLTGATITRLHTVSYPKGMVTPIADIESPLQTLTISPIWTGTWTDVFTSEITGTNGIITIQDEIRFVKDFKVTSSRGLCEVYSCITNMATKYASYLTTAPQKAIEMSKYINQASAAYMAYNIGKKCGESGYEVYLELIKAVADSCGCGCGDCGPCDDNTPVQVVGCCQNVGTSGNTIVIESTGGTITITATTVGDTTTFEIDVVDAHITGLAEQAIAAASISDLGDVNTGNIASANGQVLIWSAGLGEWVRGVAALSLTELTDVTITSIQSGQIIKWNGTAWVNANNTFSLLSDVNASGLSNGNAFKWDSGTSKFIPFAPKLTLSSLNDVNFSGTVTTNTLPQRIIYNPNGATWDVWQYPTRQNLTNYQTGYSGGPVGSAITAGGTYDIITDMVTLCGVIANTVGSTSGDTFLASVPTSLTPNYDVVASFVLGVGVDSLQGFGIIFNSTGNIFVIGYYDASGTRIYGTPAGGISIQGIAYKKTLS